jgi:hypothetical protein
MVMRRERLTSNDGPQRLNSLLPREVQSACWRSTDQIRTESFSFG